MRIHIILEECGELETRALLEALSEAFAAPEGVQTIISSVPRPEASVYEFIDQLRNAVKKSDEIFRREELLDWSIYIVVATVDAISRDTGSYFSRDVTIVAIKNSEAQWLTVDYYKSDDFPVDASQLLTRHQIHVLEEFGIDKMSASDASIFQSNVLMRLIVTTVRLVKGEGDRHGQ
ncbi:MAG TPA: hypothetical protein VD928_00985 [Candidatus Paceibacterota bacterium]|nr:hypothetical protein [Candidatus Paceibacterota bacterium]